MLKDSPQLTIAHLLLSGTSILALKYSPSGGTVSYGTFGNILLYGIAGFIRYGKYFHLFIAPSIKITNNYIYPSIPH